MNAEEIIKEMYMQREDLHTDIWEHLPTLKAYAEKCEHITELGTRTGNSTIAFLAGKPKTLICYDLVKSTEAQQIEEVARQSQTNFKFYQANVLNVEIEPTDLLFIDTYHTGEQLAQELKLHAHKARKFIIFHDTMSFGEFGEDGKAGLWSALNPFLENYKDFVRLKAHYPNNNGLTILEVGKYF